jgi:hypothetical protein
MPSGFVELGDDSIDRKMDQEKMRLTLILSAAWMFVALTSFGIAQQKAPPTTRATKAQTGDSHSHHHENKGPHHGELMEIGKEEYHAEIVLNESKHQLDIYLFDSNASTAVDIDAQFLALNMKIGGKPMQFKLKPVRQETDRPGMASCFSLVSKDMIDGMHHANADARLALKIAQKPYTLKLEHKHDHKHDHENHDKGTAPTKR